jgi:hypothetical protein
LYLTDTRSLVAEAGRVPMPVAYMIVLIMGRIS